MGKIESDIAEYVGNHSFRKTVDNHSLQTGRETEINHQSGLLYYSLYRDFLINKSIQLDLLQVFTMLHWTFYLAR